jgi:hypothetical protein
VTLNKSHFYTPQEFEMKTVRAGKAALTTLLIHRCHYDINHFYGLFDYFKKCRRWFYLAKMAKLDLPIDTLKHLDRGPVVHSCLEKVLYKEQRQTYLKSRKIVRRIMAMREKLDVLFAI